MRKLIVSTFASLDGIMQAPGGPEEDPTGGFTLGGWMFNYWDDVMDLSASGFDGKDRELVLGRRTYEIFEAYWPYQPDDHPIAKTLNAAKKYVASLGSGNLIQTLQAALLIDEYNVWTFPVVLGRGKRLFGETAKPSALRLVRSQVSKTGVVMSNYVPGGDIQPGSFTSAEPSKKELARRKKMANEMW